MDRFLRSSFRLIAASDVASSAPNSCADAPLEALGRRIVTRRRSRLATPGARALRFETCEVRAMFATDLPSVSGIKFNDLTGDGFSADDVPLAGVSIQLFKDTGDNTFDAADTLISTQVTAAGTGAYAFSGLTDGRYFIQEVTPAGSSQTGGPAFYTLDVIGGVVYSGAGLVVDNFDSPTTADTFAISATNPNPTLLKESGTGILGGERDILITVLGTPNPISANGFVGGATGVFNLGTASSGPGTSVVLQYDGTDTDTPGPPAALNNAAGLSTDLTGGGVNNGLRLDFNFLQVSFGGSMQVKIDATGPGGATATATVDIAEDPNAFSHFIPFASFTTAGGFSFANLTSLQFTLNSAGGQDNDYEVAQILAVDQTSSGLNFANAVNRSSLGGFVYVDANNDGIFQAGETPLAGVSITLSGTDDLNNVITQTQQTGVNGSYNFTGLRPGTYQIIEAQPAAYFDGKDTIGTPGGTTTNDKFSNIVLGAGVTGVNNNFGEVAPASLSGFVYVDANNDGVFQASETPLQGVTVTLTGTNDLGVPISQTQQTTVSGAYNFTNLRPGTYTLTESQPAGFVDGKDTIGTPGGNAANDLFSNIVLTGGTAGVNNNFGELVPGSLSGFTYIDANDDGIFQAGEQAIAGTTITLTGVDDLGANVSHTTTTNASGLYTFANLRPGTYTLTETQPAGLLDGKDTIGTPGGNTTNDAFSNIIVVSGTAGQNNNFGELQGAALAGFVYVDANNDGIFQAGETAIPNATVTLTGTDDLGNAVNQTQQTTVTGAYNFSGLRPGTYVLSESQPSGFLDGKDTIGTPGGATTNDMFSNIVLTSGTSGANNNFGELLPASLAGFVYTDANNDGVFQASESPIAGATVTLTGTDDLGNAVTQTQQTTAGGAYNFTGLRPGTYTLSETQPSSFLDGKDTIGTPGGNTANDVFSNIVLSSGTAGANNNFGELSPASLAGFVYVDANNDGVFQAGETAIPNAVITLTGTDDLGNAVNQTQQTTATGAYNFTGLRPGTYTLTETQPSGFLDGKDTIGTPGGNTANDAFSNIVLSSGTAGASNNFGELSPASLAGFVYVDANNDGVFQAGETPITGATVTLTGTDDLGAAVSQTQQTLSTGAYNFTGLRPGTYKLTETQPSGFLDGKDTIGTPGGNTTNDAFSNIVLSSGTAGANNNFGELASASLAGFVYVDANNDGVFQATETPITSATVTLTGTDDLGNAVNQTQQTLSTGAYNFTGLRPGTYTLTETQPSGFLDGMDTIGTPGGTAGNDVLSNIVLTSGTAGANNNFGELTPASLAGFVYVDANNDGVFQGTETAIPNVTITLTGTNDLGAAVSQTTTTNTTGLYTFSNLRPGTYTITETQPSGFTDGIDTIGTPGGTTGNDVFSNVVLTSGTAGANNNFGERTTSGTTTGLSGFVYVDGNKNGQKDRGELPIGGVIIVATGTDTSGNAVTKTTTTDSTGAFSFTNLPAGTYSLKETQPSNFIDGATSVGTLGGTAATNAISAITLPTGTTGTDNDFGEVGLTPAFITKRFYLFPAQTISLTAVYNNPADAAIAAANPPSTTATATAAVATALADNASVANNSLASDSAATDSAATDGAASDSASANTATPDSASNLAAAPPQVAVSTANDSAADESAATAQTSSVTTQDVAATANTTAPASTATVTPATTTVQAPPPVSVVTAAASSSSAASDASADTGTLDATAVDQALAIASIGKGVVDSTASDMADEPVAAAAASLAALSSPASAAGVDAALANDLWSADPASTTDEDADSSDLAELVASGALAALAS